MTGPRRILAIYYSLTRQMESVVQNVAGELEAAGHAVDRRRITPIRDWTLPFDMHHFYVDWTRTWLGANLTQPLRPMDLNHDAYDHIILGFQPWYLAPSIPVNSFLQSPMAEIFRDKKVIALVTCRGRWERSLRIARDLIEARGGEVVDALVIQDQEREPANMATTLYRLRENASPPPDHWLARFHPFGVGDAALEVARDYGRDLAVRLSEDRVLNQRGWRIVNKDLKLV